MPKKSKASADRRSLNRLDSRLMRHAKREISMWRTEKRRAENDARSGDTLTAQHNILYWTGYIAALVDVDKAAILCLCGRTSV